MSVNNNKMTPAELLAELKSGKGNSRSVGHVATATADELDLDFSDLAVDDSSEKLPAEKPPSRPERDSHQSVLNKQSRTRPKRDADVPDESAIERQTPVIVQDDERLSRLFERVNDLLGAPELEEEAEFLPRAPETLRETGLTTEEIERLILKFLFAKGAATGREICQQIRMPYGIVDPLLKDFKSDHLLALKGAAEMGDYEFAITEMGRERARAFTRECSYFGAAPVCLPDYLVAMERQSIAKQHATEEDLHQAFSDLIINQSILDRLGPAVNSGRGLFLFGEPGNGKTSIAERITRAFGSTIWIPRSLGIDGDIIRVFDPAVHVEVEQEISPDQGVLDLSGIDHRWVRIVRPTVIAGGELTMSQLEVVQNKQTKICEAPLQLKSNCGTLVIDDFGRQRMPVDELLNRWIVPLEKRYDFLNLPSGKKIQVPFDQLIIFSTNLEPKDLVDGAFLRRIPYKIEAPDPTLEEFHALFELMAPMMGFEYDREVVDYLIDTHYRPCERPFRACQPRDLLLQVKNFCAYKNLPRKLTREGFDMAVGNYFAVM